MADQGTLEILIDIRARLDELSKAQKGLNDTAKEANGLAAAFKTGLGIEAARRGVELITRTFEESVVAAFELAGAIKDQSENLQVSTDAYQVLGNVVREAGGDVSLLTQVISTNNRSLAEARDLSSGAAAAYRQLGLDTAKLEGLPVEQRLEEIGRAVQTAKDQTIAFGAASQVLGSRNLPTTLGALKSLASEGYTNLATAAKAAGQVMENETIVTLDRAQKQIEKFKRALAISTGQAIATALQTDPSLVQDVSNTLLGGVGAFFKFGRGLGSYLGNVTNFWAGRDMVSYDKIAADDAKRQAAIDKATADAEAKRRAADAAAARAAMDRQRNLAAAENQVKFIQAYDQLAQSNPFSTEDEKRNARIFALKEEVRWRQRLIEAIKDMPKEDEAPGQRDAKLQAQNDAIEGARRQVDALTRGTHRYGGSVRLINAQDQARDRENGVENPSYLSKGEGAKVGALDYANQLGSQGEQVAAAMQSSIGSAVNSISQGIYGWITGTQSFGDVLRNLGATVLQTLIQTIVQMGVQWLITAALGRTAILSISATGMAARKAETADVIASETAKKPAIMSNAAGSSVSSWGLAAVLGIAALIAVMAAFGGFRSGGYTGDGDPGEVAGVAHRREVVFNEGDVARWGGPAALDQMRVAGPAAIRPAAGASVLPAGATGSLGLSGGTRSQNVHVYLDKAAYFDAIRSDVSGIAHEVYEHRARS